jgi:hypothetical protein
MKTGVYVVKYDTKHGTDILVCENKREAQKAVISIICDNIFDLFLLNEDGARLVVETLPDVDKALNYFNDYWDESGSSEPERLEYSKFRFIRIPLRYTHKLIRNLTHEYEKNYNQEDTIYSH